MSIKSKKLYLLTGTYPYGNAAPFLEDELRVAEKYFSNITIISTAKNSNTKMQYVPRNASIVNIRRHRIEILPLLGAFIRMFFPKTWKEKRFAYSALGYKKSKIEVNKLIFSNYYFSYLLKKIVQELNMPGDAILYSYWMASSAYFLANYKKGHPNSTCVCRTHGGDCYIDKFYQPFRREILSDMDAVFPISERGKRSINTLLVPHTNKKNVPLIVKRLGVSKSSQKMNPPEQKNVYCIVSCSNVIALKRLDILIDSLAMIQNKKIHWVHFGDGEIMEEIQQRAIVKLVNNNITYEFKGRVANSDVLRWYEKNHVDLFVNCSDTEGIPVSIMEAFSYGIPAIARDVGGNCEIVSEKNGILLPALINAEQLSGAILEMISSEHNRIDKYREEAFNTFKNYFDADKNYKEFYDTLIKMNNRER